MSKFQHDGCRLVMIDPRDEILQMTTRYSAGFLGRAAQMGSVAAGGDADPVLLNADPVASLQNMHRIAGVVRAGIYHSRQYLDAPIVRVAAGNGYLR